MFARCRGFLIVYLYFFLTLFIISGCKGQNSEQGEKESSVKQDDTVQEIKQDIPEVLRVGMVGMGEINTIDPAKANTTAPVIVAWQIYQPLARIDSQGKIKPVVASSWSHNHEMTEWSFIVSENAWFHETNGKSKRITPKDVKASIERALKIPGYAGSLIGGLVLGAPAFMQGDEKHLEGLTITDNEIVFKLVKPFAFLPERLATTLFAIVPVNTPTETETPPVGSGGYRLDEWDKVGQRVVLRKVETPVFDRKNYPETLVIKIFKNEAVAVEELRAGNIDWLEATSAAAPLLRGINDLVVEYPVGVDIRLVALNQEKEPFKSNPEYGRVLNIAVNRTALVELLGGGQPVSNPIPSFEEKKDWLKYNLAKAREIISNIPEKDRKFEMLVEPGTEPRLLAEKVHEFWQSLGVEVELRMGLSDFFPRLINGEYQAALAYYGPPVPSPEMYVWPYRSEAIPAPNVMRYKSDRFMNIYNEYIRKSQPKQRDELALLMAESLIPEPPAIWLLKPPSVVAHKMKLYFERTANLPLFFNIRER